MEFILIQMDKCIQDIGKMVKETDWELIQLMEKVNNLDSGNKVNKDCGLMKLKLSKSKMELKILKIISKNQ